VNNVSDPASFCIHLLSESVIHMLGIFIQYLSECLIHMARNPHPPALAAVLPEVEHIAGKIEQQSIERDHQHLKGRLKVFRGCKTTQGAQRFCPAHGFVRNLRPGFYRLGAVPQEASDEIRPPWVRAWEALTAQWLVA
jgi:DDE domain